MPVNDLNNLSQQYPSYREIPTGGSGGFWNSIKNFFLGHPEVVQQFNKFNPQGQQTLEQLLNTGLSNLQNPYQGFEPIKQDALNTFFQDIVPGLQNQFSASGSNAISSPSLQTNLSSAGSGLAQRLAAFQSQYGQQNQQNALQQLQLGLTPQYDTAYSPRRPGFLENTYNQGSQAAQSLIPLAGKFGGL